MGGRLQSGVRSTLPRTDNQELRRTLPSRLVEQVRCITCLFVLFQGTNCAAGPDRSRSAALGEPGSNGLHDFVMGELVPILDQSGHGLAHIVQMSEAIALFDFSNVRCQTMVGEYAFNPAPEISAAHMSTYKFFRIYWGLTHFQFRICGMSCPYLSIYSLCSMSLSLSCCFR